MGDLLGIERHRTLENIRLYRFTLAVTLQREDFPPSGVHLYEVKILGIVQLSEFFCKIVVQTVKHLAQGGIFPSRVSFVQVKVVVGIADFDVKRCPFLLLGQKLQRVKHGTETVQVTQIADTVVGVRYQRSFLIMLR